MITNRVWWTSLSTSFCSIQTPNFHSLMPSLDFHLHIYFLRNFLMYFFNSTDSLSFARCFQFNKLFFFYFLVRHVVARFGWKEMKKINSRKISARDLYHTGARDEKFRNNFFFVFAFFYVDTYFTWSASLSIIIKKTKFELKYILKSMKMGNLHDIKLARS